MDERQEDVRRLLDRPGPEDEHEAAVLRVVPDDLADARHAGADHAAGQVEPDLVADVEILLIVQALFDRHLGIQSIRRARRRKGLVPERARRDAFVVFERVAVRDAVFPSEVAPLPDLDGGIQLDAPPRDAHDARTHHRNDPRFGRVSPHERRDAADLVRLHVDQHEIRRVPAGFHRELRQQVRLHDANRQNEERAQSHRHEHHARLVTRAAQADHGVAQCKPRGPRERRHTPDEPAARQMQHERHQREASRHEDAGLQRAGLPDRHGA